MIRPKREKIKPLVPKIDDEDIVERLKKLDEKRANKIWDSET